ncbi:hypothetical protein GM658_07860 [Pseudoduganella eburnea]|uniref:Uncharacterized protein n=1 Tax=Massilia eburnea TaxID=1776165 RepID=A0A6L6QDE6_9BURK|nr:hypothetical protein [Massilia eburnea]MTW10518.1 hypothetical protein [Massilia eburnea]
MRLKFMKVGLTLLFLSAGFAANAAPTLTDQQILEISQTYPTPLGIVRFVNKEGQLDTSFDRIMLNSDVLLTPSHQVDGWGSSQILMKWDGMAKGTRDSFPSDGKKLGRRLTKRLVIAEGPDGNCVRQFIILDFTLDKPFVSKRFGENKDMKSCLMWEGAKWGARESRITLSNGTFIYKTGGDVVKSDD